MTAHHTTERDALVSLKLPHINVLELGGLEQNVDRTTAMSYTTGQASDQAAQSRFERIVRDKRYTSIVFGMEERVREARSVSEGDRRKHTM